VTDDVAKKSRPTKMASEVGDEFAAGQPAGGALSPETDIAELGLLDKTGNDDDSSSGENSDATGSPPSSSGRSDVAARNNLPTVANRIKNLRRASVDGEEVGDEGDDDLARHENSTRDFATAATQQLLPVSRSQYHSIQQLSRPSNTVSSAGPGLRILNAARRPVFTLDNNNAELCRRSGSQAPPSRSAEQYIGEAVDEDVAADDGRAGSDDDEGSACTDDDHHVTYGVQRHSQASTSVATTETGNGWPPQSGSGNATVEHQLEAKRARVEHIVRSIRTPPGDSGPQPSASIPSQVTQQQNSSEARRQRRKQFAPLQHQNDERRQSLMMKRPHVDDDDEYGSDRDADEQWSQQQHPSENSLRLGLQRVQDRLADMHQKYMKYLHDDSSDDDGIVDVGNDVSTDKPIKRLRDEAVDAVIGADFNRNEILRAAGEMSASNEGRGGSGSLEALTRMLKAEISDSVGSMVDEIFRSFVVRRLGGDGGARRRGDPAEGDAAAGLTQRSTMSTASSPDAASSPSGNDTAAACSVVPPPLTPIAASTAAVDLRLPVPAAPVLPVGNVEVMERAAAAAAKLVIDRYSVAAMATYLDNAFLLHGKTAFEMPPSSSASTPAASVTSRLFTPTPFYPAAQHPQLQSHIIKVVLVYSSSLVIAWKCLLPGR